MDTFHAASVLAAGQRNMPRAHHRPIEFYNSPSSIKRRDDEKQVERHAREVYATALASMEAANAARVAAAAAHAIGDMRSIAKAIRDTANRVGHLNTAVASLAECEKWHPQSHLYPLKRAECLLELGDTGEAAAAKAGPRPDARPPYSQFLLDCQPSLVLEPTTQAVPTCSPTPETLKLS
jgi:hypothetical protein